MAQTCHSVDFCFSSRRPQMTIWLNLRTICLCFCPPFLTPPHHTSRPTLLFFSLMYICSSFPTFSCFPEKTFFCKEFLYFHLLFNMSSRPPNHIESVSLLPFFNHMEKLWITFFSSSKACKAFGMWKVIYQRKHIYYKLILLFFDN